MRDPGSTLRRRMLLSSPARACLHRLLHRLDSIPKPTSTLLNLCTLPPTLDRTATPRTLILPGHHTAVADLACPLYLIAGRLLR